MRRILEISSRGNLAGSPTARFEDIAEMFVHKNQLAYLLNADDYCAEEHRQTELKRMFLPAWHLGATKSELPNHGDVLSVDLFGHPLKLHNIDGQYFADYEEPQDDERNDPIPDANYFCSSDGENSQLRNYRVETCGDLIFVALSDEAPPLREFLNPFWSAIEASFQTPNWRLKDIWEYDCPSNWKVPAENTLESYHIPHVHSKTFGGIYPSEAATQHILKHRYTMMEYDAAEDPRLDVWQSRIARWLGTEPTNLHFHRHIHPHMIVVTTSLISYIVNYLPVSPRLTRVRLRMYSYRGTKFSLWARYIAWVFGIFSKHKMRQIMSEDLGLFADQQRGLEASRHKGVLGTREERIFAFQWWWMDQMGRKVSRNGEPLPPSLNIAGSHGRVTEKHPAANGNGRSSERPT